MNTAVNINPVSGASAEGKVAHVFRVHSLKPKRNSDENERTNHVIVVRNFVHTQSKNLGVRELSSKLATYRKRYEEATKPKTKERNLAKCKEIEKEILARGKKRKGREAELVEASWAITKFPPALALRTTPKYTCVLQKLPKQWCKNISVSKKKKWVLLRTSTKPRYICTQCLACPKARRLPHF